MRLLTAAVLGLGLGFAPPALAQSIQYGPFTPYGESLYTEGPGIKLGSSGLVFHPGVAAELGYDSNVLLSNTPISAGLFRGRLHLDLATLPLQRLDAASAPKLEFRFSGLVEYRQYFAGSIDGSARQINGQIDTALAIKPRDPLSLRLYSTLISTNDARDVQSGQVAAGANQTFDGNSVQNAFIPRIYFRFGLLGQFRPGNGPLELGLGTVFHLDYYLANSDSVMRNNQLALNRSLGNDANIYAQLRVLPQTTVKLEVRSTFVDYYTTGAPLPQMAPLRITLGVNSLLLPAVGVSAYAGYANSFAYGTAFLASAGRESYNSFIAGAEVRLRLAAKMRLNLGWARDIADTIFATYLADDRVYLHYDHFIWRGLAAHLRLDNYFRNYGGLADPTQLGYTGYSSDVRNDIVLNYSGELSYRALSWLEVGVNYNLIYDKTDFAFRCGAGCTQSASFLKHAVMARLDFAY